MTTFDPYTEALSADLNDLRGRLTDLHDLLYAEPAPEPRAIAQAIVAVEEIKDRVQDVAGVLQGTIRAIR
jgi:hypothetical protein